MRTMTTRVLAAAWLAAVTPSAAAAQVAAFGSAGFSYFNNGLGDAPYVWTTGGYWQQTVVIRNITVPISVSLELTFGNLLAPGRSIAFDVFLNDVDIGDLDIQSGEHTSSRVLSVRGVQGPEYTLRIQQSSETIPVGEGSLSLPPYDPTGISAAAPSTFTLIEATAVPEPSTVALLAGGLALAAPIGVRARRRRRRQSALG